MEKPTATHRVLFPIGRNTKLVIAKFYWSEHRKLAVYWYSKIMGEWRYAHPLEWITTSKSKKR